MRAARVAGVALLLAALVACSGGPDDHSVNAEKAQILGGQWPFSLPSGVVGCERHGADRAVTFRPDGSTIVYALNAAATAAGFADPTAIWLDDPAAPGQKVDLSWMADYGSAICH